MERDVGSIIELQGFDTPHCGVVIGPEASAELLAYRDPDQWLMICCLALVHHRQPHPLTQALPTYRIRYQPPEPLPTALLRQRLRHLTSRYHGQPYEIIFHNCQHFAWELSTGYRRSPDADPWFPLGLLIGGYYWVRDWILNPLTPVPNWLPLFHDLQVWMEADP